MSMHAGRSCSSCVVRIWSVNSAAREGVRVSPRCMLLPTTGYETVPVSPTHTDRALLRRACHGLKIDAHPSRGLAVETTAAAAAGESWPRCCGLLPSASGTETPAAQRGRGATAGGRLPGQGCERGRGQERGPGSRASCALPGSLPPPSAPGCLGWQRLGDGHGPVTTAIADGGRGVGDRGPWNSADGTRECRGVYPGTEWGFSTPPGEIESPEGLSTPDLLPAPFYHSASHRQQNLLPEKVVLK